MSAEAPPSNLEDLLDGTAQGSSELSTDDIGWLDPDLAPPEVKSALLKANKRGDPVTCTTELGLHVFQVLDTRSGRRESLSLCLNFPTKQMIISWWLPTKRFDAGMCQIFTSSRLKSLLVVW